MKEKMFLKKWRTFSSNPDSPAANRESTQMNMVLCHYHRWRLLCAFVVCVVFNAN